MAAVTCTCSQDQLNHVGCDCEASYVVVKAWKKGYASADGLVSFLCPPGVSYTREARRLVGPFAEVYSVRLQTPARSSVSVAYARAMTAGDNT